jgi:hypothetical protein
MIRTAAATALLVLASLTPAPSTLRADAPDEAAVRARDTAFWAAYNACETPKFRGFFTDDVEFYHDRGGATLGLAALDAALGKQLCGGDSRLRREAVDDTVHVFLLRDGGTVYGAILEGEHRFYVTQPGKAEFLDGRARFAHLWRFADGTWKMSRILSYDHGPGR